MKGCESHRVVCADAKADEKTQDVIMRRVRARVLTGADRSSVWTRVPDAVHAVVVSFLGWRDHFMYARVGVVQRRVCQLPLAAPHSASLGDEIFSRTEMSRKRLRQLTLRQDDWAAPGISGQLVKIPSLTALRILGNRYCGATRVLTESFPALISLSLCYPVLQIAHLPIALQKLVIHCPLVDIALSAPALRHLCRMPLVHLSLYPLPADAYFMFAQHLTNLTTLATMSVPSFDAYLTPSTAVATNNPFDVFEQTELKASDAALPVSERLTFPVSERLMLPVSERLTFPVLRRFECVLKSNVNWRLLRLPRLETLVAWDPVDTRRDWVLDTDCHRAFSEFLPNTGLRTLVTEMNAVLPAHPTNYVPLTILWQRQIAPHLRSLVLSQRASSYVCRADLSGCTALTHLQYDLSRNGGWTTLPTSADQLFVGVTSLVCLGTRSLNSAFFAYFPALQTLTFCPPQLDVSYRLLERAAQVAGLNDSHLNAIRPAGIAHQSWRLACAPTLRRLHLTGTDAWDAAGVALLLDEGGGCEPNKQTRKLDWFNLPAVRAVGVPRSQYTSAIRFMLSERHVDLAVLDAELLPFP